MSSTPMDLDKPDKSSSNGPSLNIHRTLGGGSATSNLSDIMGTFRPTKLFKRESFKGGPTPFIQSIDFDDDGGFCMASCSDETMQIYNVREGKHDKTCVSQKYGVKLAKFTHTSSSIIYASTKQNDAIRYLATHDNSFIRYFEGHEGQVTCLAVHPGSDQFISCSQDGTVRLWDTQSKHWQGQLNLRAPYLAAYDPSGTIFAVGCPTAGSILLYDLRNYDKAPFTTIDIVDQVRHIDTECLLKGWTKLEFSNDGKSLLLGTRGKGHYLLDAFDGTFKAYLYKPLGGTKRQATGEAPAAANSTAGTTLSSMDSSGDCCFTPDGRYVISGSQRDVFVWDTMKHPEANNVLSPTYTLPDKREASVVAFNPRYNMFATGDQEVVFWVPDPHA